MVAPTPGLASWAMIARPVGALCFGSCRVTVHAPPRKSLTEPRRSRSEAGRELGEAVPSRSGLCRRASSPGTPALLKMAMIFDFCPAVSVSPREILAAACERLPWRPHGGVAVLVRPWPICDSSFCGSAVLLRSKPRDRSRISHRSAKAARSGNPPHSGGPPRFIGAIWRSALRCCIWTQRLTPSHPRPNGPRWHSPGRPALGRPSPTK